MTTIHCCQLDPRLHDLDGNLRRATAAVRAAAEAAADVIVLPELATSGYMYESADEIGPQAIGRDHPVFRSWAEALVGTDAVVVAGFAERAAMGVFNSVAVVDATGVRLVYRKAHLWHREKAVFCSGDEPAPTVDTRHGRLGVLVCYELEIPEVPRSLALAGADLLVAPTNWGLIDVPAEVEPPQLMMARAAARASHVYVAVCDRAGVERDQRWTGGSAVIDAEGWVLARPDAEGTARASIDALQARERDLSPVNNLFADRRPALYSALTTRPAPRE